MVNTFNVWKKIGAIMETKNFNNSSEFDTFVTAVLRQKFTSESSSIAFDKQYNNEIMSFDNFEQRFDAVAIEKMLSMIMMLTAA